MKTIKETIKGECKKMNKCANKETKPSGVKDPVKVRAAKKAWVTIRKNKELKVLKEKCQHRPLDDFGVFGPTRAKTVKPSGVVVPSLGVVRAPTHQAPKSHAPKKNPKWVKAAKKAWVTIRKNKAHKVASDRMKKVWADRKRKKSKKVK